MQLNRCPVCHSRIGLEQLAQDDAGRELMAMLAKLDSITGNTLIAYLGLFRSASRDLANDRALKLATEALALEVPNLLVPAMQETVASIRAKREAGTVKPLTNHNYLKSVLESVRAHALEPVGRDSAGSTDLQPGYRSAAASQQRLNDTDW